MAFVRRNRLWLVLVLGLVLVLTVCVDDCDAAKKKKTKKKTKKVETPVKSGDDEDDDDSSEKKPEDKRKIKADGKTNWNKMTKADWDRLEQEAEGPGEPWKPPEAPNVDFDPQNPMEYVQASKKGKPAMMFATLDKMKDPKDGKMRDRDKPETEEIAFKHKSLMQSGHLDATPYVIDPNKILWTVQDGSKGFEVKNFLMRQPEVVEFDWDQQKETKATWVDPDAEL